jgi:deoxyribodipyrimidine photolyase-related protein
MPAVKRPNETKLMIKDALNNSETILIPVLGDQLSLSSAALREVNQSNAVIVMAEVFEENQHVWSSRMRSAVFLSGMRHFAQTLEHAGWKVIYFRIGEHAHPGLESVWREVVSNVKPAKVRACELGDYRVETMLKAMCKDLSLPLQLIDDDHFLISRADFARWAGKSKQLRMEMFYRLMRKRLNILMNGDEPEGGQWNFDDENRKSFKKAGPENLIAPKRFLPDEVTRQVIADLDEFLPSQPGNNKDFAWPVTREQGLLALEDFIEFRFSQFGPTQDAMWTDQPFLFHSLLSVALNLKLISPKEVVEAAELRWRQGKADLASVEGFIRQIIGWREFMRGVYWLDMPLMKEANHFGYDRALPSWYWSGKTHMQCMRQAVGQTLQHGYAHHIQRLMVTGNFALLAGLAPQAVCDWYLAVYVDAVEWVELPNTAGMALFANGGRFTTKPYVASGAYIKRMSNYCQGCRYDPAVRVGSNACPMTTLYWSFLDRHAAELSKNPRAALMMKNYERIEAPQIQAIRDQAAVLLKDLEAI